MSMTRTWSRRRIGFAAFMATVVVLVAGLGVWQLDRRAWKDDLIARIESRINDPPVPLPATIDDPEAWDYRPVTVEGYASCMETLQVSPRVRNGAVGAHAVWLIRRDDAPPVLANLGWTSQHRNLDCRRSGDPVSPIVVTGIARPPEPVGLFTPANDPATGQWFTIDPQAMAAALGSPSVLPVVVWAAATPDGWQPPPYPQPPGVDLPDNHLQYAVTWFSLAAILAVLTLVVLMRRTP